MVWLMETLPTIIFGPVECCRDCSVYRRVAGNGCIKDMYPRCRGGCTERLQRRVTLVHVKGVRVPAYWVCECQF